MQRSNVGSDYLQKLTVEKSSRGFIEDAGGPMQLTSARTVKLTDAQAYLYWENNEWVQATVNRIVADCTKVMPVIRPRDNQIPSERQKKKIKRIQKLLDNPNDNDEAFADIREKVIRDMLIIGRGAIEKIYAGEDGEGDLEEIYSLLAKNLRIRCDDRGNVPIENAYVLTAIEQAGAQDSVNTDASRKTSKETVTFDRDEVIFMVYTPYSLSMYGHKPLDTLAATVATDILRDTYNSQFFMNNGEASGILSVKGMGRNELRNMKQYFQKFHKGSSNAHKLAVVNVPVDWIPMSVTNRDMQFQEYGAELRQKIFAVYGMQPIIMGVLDSSTGRLNSEQQVQAYKDGALMPILRKESYYYTQHICWDGFGYTDLEIIFPDIDTLNMEAQSKIDTEDVKNAIQTINEVRRRRHMPDVPWGDKPMSIMPGGQTVGNSSGAGKKPTKKPAAKPISTDAKKRVSRLLYDLKQYAVDNFDRFNEEHFYRTFEDRILNTEEHSEFLASAEICRKIKHVLQDQEEGKSLQNVVVKIDNNINRFKQEAENKKFFVG
jgi:HK97 family phage portal protein